MGDTQVPWTSENVTLLRQFLDTETGQRLFNILITEMPPLLDGRDVNMTLVRNGEVRGYAQAVREIRERAYPIPDVQHKTVENYPDPEDDSKWDDNNQPKA